MIVILTGIVTGIGVVGGIVGGLAAAGIFDSTALQTNESKQKGKEEKPNLLKGEIAIYKTFLKYANDITGLKNEKEIEGITPSTIHDEITKLKSKLDGFYKIHFDNIYAEAKDKTTLTDEELAGIQNKLGKYTENFKEKLFTEYRWHTYDLFSNTIFNNPNFNKKSEADFKKLSTDEQYNEIDDLKNYIPAGVEESRKKVIETLKKIDEATNLNDKLKKLIQKSIGIGAQDFIDALMNSNK